MRHNFFIKLGTAGNRVIGSAELGEECGFPVPSEQLEELQVLEVTPGGQLRQCRQIDGVDILLLLVS
jgi:hypothetical protein